MRHLKSMKWFMLMGILLISQMAVCQNGIWSSPICNRFSISSGLTIKSVQFYSNATIIEFLYDNHFGNAEWVQLSQECEIVAYPSRATYKLTSATGIPYAPTKHYFSSSNEKLSFTCIFPAVPKGTTSLDWIEEGEWVITGIRSQNGTPVDNSKGNKYISETWIMPEYSTLSANKGLELTEVEITNSQTVLWFTYTNHYDSNGWANIDRETKIVAYPSGKSLSLTKSKGLPIAPSRHNFSRRGEQLRFSLTFPALPQGTTKFNFIENHSSTWKLFDICPSSQSVSQSVSQNAAKESGHEDEELEYSPFQIVDVRPRFRGGDANKFSRWVNSKLIYPEIAKENGIQGRVTLQFTVDKDGYVRNVKVLRGIDPELDREAVRVVSMSPKWKPGMSQGRPVPVTYTFPVIFQLN